MNKERIKRDRMLRPFFMLDNRIIDEGFGLESVAILAYIARCGDVSQDEIMQHFGLNAHHVYNAVKPLQAAGLVGPVELRYED